MVRGSFTGRLFPCSSIILYFLYCKAYITYKTEMDDEERELTPGYKIIHQKGQPESVDPGGRTSSKKLDNSTLTKSWVYRKRTRTNVVRLKCNLCSKRFTSKKRLDRHVLEHTAEKPHKCDVCEESFRQNYQLQKHMREHTGGPHHVCEICDKSFKRNGDLNRHMRVHAVRKPFNCELCDRSYTRRYDLNRHVSVHHGKKSNTYDSCLKYFKQKKVIGTSKSTHTDELAGISTLERLAEKGESSKHIEVVPSKNKLECEICHKSFKGKLSLQRHKETHLPNLTK